LCVSSLTCSVLLLLPSAVFPLLRPHPSSTLFPYTTLFRSEEAQRGDPVVLVLLDLLAVDLDGLHVLAPLSVGVVDDVDLIGDAQVEERVARTLGLPLRSEEHTSELQSRFDLVCRLLLEKKKEEEDKLVMSLSM